MENTPILYLSKKDLNWFTVSNHMNSDESEFDKLFKFRWKRAENNDIMNYKVNEEILQTKILSGFYKLVAQFNPMRVSKRRPPAIMSSLKQAFDSKKFNFTQVKKDEILFDLIFEECCWKMNDKMLKCTVIVNTAPISPFHGLLIPSRFECKRQILDLEGIEIGIASVLASNTPALKVGFNSLGGMATVNHYHLHIYYLPYPIYVETADCDRVAGPLYTFRKHYAPGFVFEVQSEDIEETARNVITLIDFLLENEICHNVMITRGIICNNEKPNEEIGKYDTVRVCLWIRKPTFGMKLVDGFSCGLCEFGGHIPVYDEETWEKIREEDVIEAMRDVCVETYERFLPSIKELFS